jgi:hypothetical protein
MARRIASILLGFNLLPIIRFAAKDGWQGQKKKVGNGQNGYAIGGLA